MRLVLHIAILPARFLPSRTFGETPPPPANEYFALNFPDMASVFSHADTRTTGNVCCAGTVAVRLFSH